MSKYATASIHNVLNTVGNTVPIHKYVGKTSTDVKVETFIRENVELPEMCNSAEYHKRE